jgi:predicted RND superfamily exporter protein
MEENFQKIVNFFMKNRFSVFSILFLIFVLSFLVQKKLKGKKGSFNYHFNTERAYKEWKKTPSKKLFNELNGFLKKDPSLKLKYEGLITQNLLYNENKEAFERGLKSLKNKEKIKHYSNFSKTSLFSEKDLKKALLQSIVLKKNLEKEKKNDLFLYFFNLLRISFLQKKLGNKCEELSSLKEVESYITKSKKAKIHNFLKNFKKGEMSLQDYITHRKKSITK